MKSNRKRTPKDEIIVSEQFAATIGIEPSSGKKKLQITSPIYYQHQLNKYKEGTKVSLFLSTRKPKRSEAQNRYYWGVYLPLIMAETGERNIEALHALFQKKFLTLSVDKVRGEIVRVMRSTTALGVGEFCCYILDIEEETGIEAPPTENYDLAPLSTVKVRRKTTA